MSFSPPTPFSRSAIGPTRLLLVVVRKTNALREQIDAESNADARLSVWFPNEDEQWPTDDNGDRMFLSVRDVIDGKVKHARLKLDGINISRAEGEAFLADHDEKANQLRKTLAAPFSYKGKDYMTDNGKDPEDEGYKVIPHTLGSLFSELSGKLRALGLDPWECIKEHGYNG